MMRDDRRYTERRDEERQAEANTDEVKKEKKKKKVRMKRSAHRCSCTVTPEHWECEATVAGLPHLLLHVLRRSPLMCI